MSQIILYGMVRDRTLRALTERYFIQNGDQILFYVDDKISEKSPEQVKIYNDDMIPVVSPNRIISFPEAVIVVMSSMGFKKINDYLLKNGICNTVLMAPVLGWRFIMDSYCGPEENEKKISGWIQKNEEKIRTIYDSSDDYTNRLLEEIVKERKSFKPVPIERYIGFGYEEYFADSIVSPHRDFIFVDGGVYVGDSIEQIQMLYGNSLVHVLGYEPDQENYNIALSLIEKLEIENKVVLINKGLWDKRCELGFSMADDEMNIGEGTETVQVEALDDRLDYITEIIENNGNVDICIKMDLEGCEKKAIEGSERVIRAFHPYMAICIYHKMTDILEIPQAILSIREDYRFFLRSGVHTELYAVPV